METKHNLEDETLDALQELIEINIDSAKGFQEAADVMSHQTFAKLFRGIAVERETQATELQRFVLANREKPETEGSLAGSLHRLWIDFRAAINGGDPKVVLIEAERGEDAIKGKYEDLIKDTAGSAVNDVLLRQYKAVKDRHDAVRDLRDAQ